MPFEENTYVLHLEGRQEAVVVDPGLEPDLIIDYLRAAGLGVAAILNTHGHADHIGGNAALKHAFPDAPLLIGAGDAPMLTDPMANLSAWFGMPIESPPADRLLADGESVEAAGLTFAVHDLPGHSPGHVVFVLPGTPARVLAGDTLMRGSIGRTDFPGGDTDQLLTGIRDKLFTLPEPTLILPGHGPTTTVGREMQSNPFVGVAVWRR